VQETTFIPEGDPDKISTADTNDVLDHDAVMTPALLVPDGSDLSRPGYPYEYFGRYAWCEDSRLDMLEPMPGGAGGSGWSAGSMQGAGDTGDAQPGQQSTRQMRPAPTLAVSQGYADPARTAVVTLRAPNVLPRPNQPAVSHDADVAGETVTQADAAASQAAGSSGIHASVQNDPLNRTDPPGRSDDQRGSGQVSPPTPAVAQAQRYVDPVRAAIATWRGLRDAGLVRPASDQTGGTTSQPPNAAARSASAQPSQSIEDARV
jgi:hypothetical protein